MTLRDNIDTMSDIITNAPNNFINSVYRLGTGIKAGQTDIKERIAKLLTIKDAFNNYYCTFSESYMNLFMGVYSKVQEAINTIMTRCAQRGESYKTCALSKEEFDAIGVESIGVERVAMSANDVWHLLSSDKVFAGPNRTITLHLYPYGPINRYKWWDFPEKFYYDPRYGGVDYGDLYLYDPEHSIQPGSSPEQYWHEDIKSWGPFKFTTTQTEDYMPYSGLLECLAGLYGRCVYQSSETGDVRWAEWPEGNVSLKGKIFKYGLQENNAPSSLTDLKRDEIAKHAITLTYQVDPDTVTTGWAGGSEELVFPLDYVDKDLTGAVHVANVANISFSRQAADPGYTKRTITNTTPTDPGFGSWYEEYTGFLVTGFTRIDSSILDATIPVDNSHLSTYSFTKFLQGQFGEDPVSGSLNNKLITQAYSTDAVNRAKIILNWLSTVSQKDFELNLFMHLINSFDALVQLADLYSVMYAIERVLYGHIHRVTK